MLKITRLAFMFAASILSASSFAAKDTSCYLDIQNRRSVPLIIEEASSLGGGYMDWTVKQELPVNSEKTLSRITMYAPMGSRNSRLRLTLVEKGSEHRKIVINTLLPTCETQAAESAFPFKASSRAGTSDTFDLWIG